MSTTFDPNYIQPKDYVLLSIKVLVQNPEDKILLLHRSKLSGGRRAWDFCGGATEKKENPIQTAAREAQEEAGINITNIEPIAITTFNKEDFVVMIGFKAITDSTKITLSWEHDDYLWVTKDEALQMELPEFFKNMIEKLD